MKQSQTKQDTRGKCRKLRSLGRSIGQIAHTLGLSESTVHWHVKDIQLTQIQKDQLRAQKRELMAIVNAKRRGKPLHPVRFRKPGWCPELVQLIAHLNFDGRIDRYGCQYYNRSKRQTQHVADLLERLLRIHPRLRQRRNQIWMVSYYNVAVASWLAEKEREILAAIADRPDWQQQWLRALFDDEGHVYFSGSKRRVRASQNDANVLLQAKQFLEGLAIQSRIDARARAVEISGRENLKRFSRYINFSPGLCINQHRKNGLWDQAFEKRTLLQTALNSYRLE